jgi:hypothetical protein
MRGYNKLRNLTPGIALRSRDQTGQLGDIGRDASRLIAINALHSEPIEHTDRVSNQA